MSPQSFKINFSKKKAIGAIIAIFCFALISGFISESNLHSGNTDTLRQNLVIEMARVLKCLNPLLKHNSNSKQELPEFFKLPIQFKDAVQNGVVKSFPDGSWKLSQPLTTGEAIFYLGKLVDYIEKSLKNKPTTISASHLFADIPHSHWLNSSLQKLFSIGAMYSTNNNRLNPDRLISFSKVKEIADKIINYFSSDLLIVSFDGINVRIYPKGAANMILAKNISISFNGKEWKKLNQSNKFAPVFNSHNSCNIYFKHPSFFTTSALTISKREQAIAFVKLKRNYANFSNNLINSELPDEIENSEEAHEKLKKRLAEIRQRNRNNEFEMKNNVIASTLKSNEITELKAAKIEPKENFVQKNNNDYEFSRDKYFYPDLPKKENKIIETPNIPDPIETFKGVVVNAKNQKGIKGAIVLMSGKYYTTNKKGQFIFKAVRHKTLDITAYCEGYKPLKLKIRAGYRNRTLKLSIKPIMLTFYGQVVNSVMGSPVSKALIKIDKRVTRSAIDGSFSLKGLKPGYHQLSCYSNNYMEAHDIVFVDSDKQEKHQIMLRPLTRDVSDYQSKPENIGDDFEHISPSALLNQNDAGTEYQNWVIDNY